MSFGQLLDIIRARFLLILVTTVVTVAVAAGLSLSEQNKYTASTFLVLNLEGNSPFETAVAPTAQAATYLATQLDIMRSQKVALAVVDSLQLDRDPGWKSAYAEKDQLVPIRQWIASQIMENVDVEPMQSSRVVSLSYEAMQPTEAARIANAYAQGYIATSLELTREPSRRNAAWFDEQVKTLRERLETARGRMSQLQAEKGIVALEERLSAETARLDDISRNLVQAQIDVSTARARQLGFNHPDYQAALQRERTLLGAMDMQKRNIQELQSRRDEVGTLEREVESEQRNYDATLQAFFQTAMKSQFNQTNIAVLSPALPPSKPSSPNLPLNLASALVLGLFLGGVAAAFAELLKPRVEMARTPQRRYVREPITHA